MKLDGSCTCWLTNATKGENTPGRGQLAKSVANSFLLATKVGCNYGYTFAVIKAL